MLLTASLRPTTLKSLTVSDADTRLGHYRSALHSWCLLSAATGARVVLLDNSGASLEALHEVTAAFPTADVSLLSRPEAAATQSEGKGNGEARILDAFAAWLDDVETLPDVITKCTGRLYIPNYPSLFRTDSPAVRAALRSDLGPRVDSRLFSVDPETLKLFLTGMASDIDEDREVHFEHVLRNRLLVALTQGSVFEPWATLPKFDGQSASFGGSYGDAQARLGRALHQGQRYLATVRTFTL